MSRCYSRTRRFSSQTRSAARRSRRVRSNRPTAAEAPRSSVVFFFAGQRRLREAFAKCFGAEDFFFGFGLLRDGWLLVIVALMALARPGPQPPIARKEPKAVRQRA